MIASMANRLRELRKAARMSQVDLAAKAGFADHTPVHKYERGKLDLSPDVAERLAPILRCHPGELFWDLPHNPFTADERHVIALYRHMTPEQRSSWMRIGTAFIREKRQKPEPKPRIRVVRSNNDR
jgi:transcriptional regulator with XRE-family HTH domain